uniref:SH3 domain-containing protein n=1 Tax=Romanomermis culicivorax TaxID=13658 RepID=A0A915K8X9_ROMCU
MHKALVKKDILMPKTPIAGQQNDDEDSWETEADFVNDMDEKSSRWGAKTVEKSGHQSSVSLDALRKEVVESDSHLKEKLLETMPKPSLGYGGKFGVQTDRVDKAAENWDYKGQTDKHASQKDYSKGFGGKFGVQEDRKDKSAVGWEYKENLAKHESQKDYVVGFGGKFGVQSDRQDKSAVGWDHKEKTAVHESQKDYVVGFGGKFGVQTDRQDKSAVGWDHKEKTAVHESQKDYSKGFGGKYGVETEKQDKSALGWDYKGDVPLHQSQKDHVVGFGGKFGVQTDRKDACAVGFDYQEKLAKHESQQHQKDSEIINARAKKLPEEDVDNENRNAKQSSPAQEIEKGRATGLRQKFEQLAMKNPDTEKIRAEEVRATKRAQMIKEIESNEITPVDYAKKENLESSICEESTVVPAAPPTLKSPVSPGAVSSSKIAHELMGRFVTHPEMKRHSKSSAHDDGNEDEWTDEPVEHQIPSKIEPTPLIPEEKEQQQNDSKIFEYEHKNEEEQQKNDEDHQPDIVKSSSSTLNNHNQSLTNETAHYVEDHPLAPPAHPMADTKIKATALYDYQAAAADEISFEPDDVITNIDM